MRIAIAADTNQGLKSPARGHFGDAPFFTLVDVTDGQVETVSVVENPYHAHHQPGQVPSFLKDQKADVVLAGGMGQRAITFFQQLGIEVATGASGTVEETVASYLRGEMRDVTPCVHDDHHHHDHHHHHHHHHDETH